jgi:UDP-2-acetamido-3-amino-2,3-dideoxy-glucuronate N-acetyltransferase
MADVMIHPTALIEQDVQIGNGTRIWSFVQVRHGASIGTDCNIGKNAFVDFGVTIGNRVKIQNNVSVYHGVTIEDGVFLGPHVCFTNDFLPRAINPDGTPKTTDDWTVGPILVRTGASIGANSTIVPNVTIGAFAMVGAGSVVTRDVPAQALVFGNPACIRGWVCRCGRKLEDVKVTAEAVRGRCPICRVEYALTPASEPRPR